MAGGLWLCFFGCVLVSSLVSLATVCAWLGSLHSYGSHTQAQIALAIALCVLSALWLAAEVCAFAARILRRDLGYHPVHTEPRPMILGVEGEATSKPGGAVAGANGVGPKRNGGGLAACPDSPLVGHLEALRACGELTAILAAMYLCDRTDVLGRSKKVQDKTYFWGLWLFIMVVALLSVKKLDKSKPLQRDQTDEWKGWMQLMFVLYHYFKEEEVYNAIRVYIASYVFMTGYGNFFLYVRGKSFTLRRNLQMMFRLNFLGFAVCIMLNNEYMLYYICAMHTLFTIFVILAVYIRHESNGSKSWVYAKVVLTLFGTVVIYDGPSFIFRALFGTLPGVRHLFAFHDPVHPEFTDEMHEFHFRSGLDRFVWILGMVYALHFPDYENGVEWLAKQKPLRRAAWNAGLLAACSLAMAAWVYFVFSKGKYEYNAVHPYTSWVPITLYMLVRNISAPLRSRYLSLFAYLGKYTLETYILQFHVWMKTTGINGSPKSLLVLVPDHFWLNFALLSAGFLFASVRLCKVTNTLKDVLIPEDNLSIGVRWLCLAGFLLACWVAAAPLSAPRGSLVGLV